MAKTSGITPLEKDYPQWYQDIVKAADLAEHSVVRGCMVIKPWGYAIWENIQRELDEMFRDTGHRNAYFPLFIPKSFFEKEAKHVEGFAKECAVVTHSKLEDDGKGGLKPAGKLTEQLIVRPTSETIIGESFKKWIKSYRDLPVLINQWANIVRWEMRTRMFLRTTEFLWQEGHTTHASSKEAEAEAKQMLEVYSKFAEDYLAFPVIRGEKTEAERFPGAVDTYTIEAMVQDRKAIQAGTSHFLGQNFSKAADIKFTDEKDKEQHAWTTSWGVSTRLIGAVIMAHSDNDGLVLPPRIAPAHVAIVPIYRNDKDKKEVMEFVNQLTKKLTALRYHERKVRVELDDRDLGGGDKLWHWVKKGIPIRLEIGPKDVANNSVFMGRRDKAVKDKESVKADKFVKDLPKLLDEMQKNIFSKANKFSQKNSVEIDDKKEFYKFFTPKNTDKPEIHGGFAHSHWCGNAKCEEQIKNDLKVTIRCIPLDVKKTKGKCICCDRSSEQRVVFAKAY